MIGLRIDDLRVVYDGFAAVDGLSLEVAPGEWDAVEDIVRQGRSVIMSGLDQDFAGRPFGVVPELLARADEVTKLTAICVVCGGEATRTQRLRDGRPAHIDDELIVVGGIGDDAYEARCRRCHEVPGA